MDWLDLLAVQGTLKSLLQHHSSKALILRQSAFFKVQLSHPYMTTGKTIALTRRIFVNKVMSLLFFFSFSFFLFSHWFILIYFTILYWFWHTSTWIHHGCTRVPNPDPPCHLPPHTISLGHPSAPAPSILYPASPLQYSCLENPREGGAWWAKVYGVAKSQTSLSNFTFTFHFHALEKEMATHSSVLFFFFLIFIFF